MEAIDISVKLTSELVVYPGDTRYTRTVLSRADGLVSPELSHFQMSSHAGTHIDAPSHFVPQGSNVDQIDMDAFIGSALVVEHNDATDIPIGLVEEQLKAYPDSQRILFKTSNSVLWRSDSFQSNYVGISLEAADFLVRSGVKLVGIDYVSVDSMKCTGMPVHARLLGAGIPLLEGLCFPTVPPGPYYLVCLPLHVGSVEGVPARAILFPP